MPPLTDALLVPLLLISHVALWVWVFNRLHALPYPRPLIKLGEKFIFVMVIILPLGLWLRYGWPSEFFARRSTWWTLPAGPYVLLSVLTMLGVIVGWLLRRAERRPLELLLSNHSENLDVKELLGGGKLTHGLKATVLGSFPGNEIFNLQINTKTLVVPRLNPALEGLSIVHLSDLHLVGSIRQSFFEVVVDRALDLQPDVIAITGDIIDKPRCLPWIDETLARLHAPHGVYWVLGNHDKRIKDTRGLRDALTSVGFIDLGGRAILHRIRGVEVVLAGNELPWFHPAASLEAYPTADDGSHPLRILLAHSPDQIRWARERAFDLMLAGHTHGGQIRIPGVGAVVSPSLYGARYAGGLFYQPPTLMHVTRGISGVDPIRWNCPPELTKLVLQPGER